MNPVDKALWYIETHFSEELTLDCIADAAGVSRYHLARAFGVATGCSVMRYVWGRRLSEAAKSLASGASNILDVAIEAGYGSHEAFTRAFRERFGLTPEMLRDQRCLDCIQRVEPIKMNETPFENLKSPRIETAKPLLIVGLRERYAYDASSGVPAQWQRFGPYIDTIPNRVGKAAYGVIYNGDDEGSDYLCGVEVADFTDVPPEMDRLRIPQQTYAIFTHERHISDIRRTWHTIWSKWLPEAEYEVADAPHMERYGASFDVQTGTGDIEIWLALKS